jgi:hypothetical protein
MNAVSTLGIDLAKNTFSVHGRTVSRGKLAELVARLPPPRMPGSPGHCWPRGLARRSGAAAESANRTEEAQKVLPTEHNRSDRRSRNQINFRAEIAD